MTSAESNKENQEAYKVSGSDTAPDSETQSSAASAQGNRTEDPDGGGNNAPNEPAEGERE